MSDTTEMHGQCLCGAVRISTEVSNHTVGACHCNMCRRWGGGPFMEVNCGQAVTFSGDDDISIYSSSDWAERGFCRNCGTHLFYRLKESGQHMVPVGLFDEGPELVFDTQVFIDQKPGYYAFSNDTRNLTGEEVFALFAQ